MSASSQLDARHHGENLAYYQGHPFDLQQAQQLPIGFQWPEQALPQHSPPLATMQHASPPVPQYSLPQMPQYVSPPVTQNALYSQGNVPTQYYSHLPPPSSEYPVQAQQTQAFGAVPDQTSNGRRTPDRRTTADSWASSYVNSSWNNTSMGPIQSSSTNYPPFEHSCAAYWNGFTERCEQCGSRDLRNGY
ncbi:hypothetical protein EKO04_002655 [Ascochyta lentis]|uniref:Uncharacterized protein n=1 Tax=Ascochyta lentis TaxID=205686 RepID=A0A8H7JB41_9PLEO|nr:hypothetical protein EKO04_002655 [Ascochyta lentis]